MSPLKATFKNCFSQLLGAPCGTNAGFSKENDFLVLIKLSSFSKNNIASSMFFCLLPKFDPKTKTILSFYKKSIIKTFFLNYIKSIFIIFNRL
jgi:hypothetical protein